MIADTWKRRLLVAGCRHYSTSLLLVASFLSKPALLLQEFESNQQNLDRYALQVDTKHWIRSLQLDDSSNWHNYRKPCTPYERIAMDEYVAVSMGDSLDTLGNLLEYNPKELILANNGLLLLPEDSLSDLSDMVDFIEDADCQESGKGQLPENYLFRFKPDKDSLSWFNANNWYSELQQGVEDYTPDAHRIPCVEDLVTFGGSPDIKKSEHSSREHSFKVNFRAHSDALQVKAKTIAGLRVSKLKIGKHSLRQSQFDNLVNSDLYRNLLFEFTSNTSLIGKENFGHQLIIDDSSVQLSSSASGEQLCNDRAGCLCGNDDPNVMKAICSFIEPIGQDQFPCHDPILTPGYCDKICGTTLTIHFDPLRFSERLITALLHTSLDLISKDYLKAVFIGHRRISETKYQIILYPSLEELSNFQEEHAKGQVILDYVHNKLSNVGIKSLWGVKSSTILSSVKWRSDKRVVFFWTSFVVSGLVAVSLFVYNEQRQPMERLEKAKNNNLMFQMHEVWTQIVLHYRRLINSGYITRNGSEATIELNVTTADEKIFEIPLDSLLD